MPGLLKLHGWTSTRIKEYTSSLSFPSFPGMRARAVFLSSKSGESFFTASLSAIFAFGRFLSQWFERKPLAKCHCIDCRYCQGFRFENDNFQRKVIKCDLWGAHMVTYDDSFCYRADPRK